MSQAKPIKSINYYYTSDIAKVAIDGTFSAEHQRPLGRKVLEGRPRVRDGSKSLSFEATGDQRGPCPEVDVLRLIMVIMMLIYVPLPGTDPSNNEGLGKTLLNRFAGSTG